MPNPLVKSKAGSTLIITTGFLAILLLLALTFSIQIQEQRATIRANLTAFKTDQLLKASLTRAVEQIDLLCGSNYPSFFVSNSKGSDSFYSQNLGLVRDYFQYGQRSISKAVTLEKNRPHWQMITDSEGRAFGRVGYTIVNSSGFIDINAVGFCDQSQQITPRGQGLSPKEIQLNSFLIPELKPSGNYIDLDGNQTPAPDGAHALLFNRSLCWKNFETLRDVTQLNASIRGDILESPISSFATFSYMPTNSTRFFMGTNETTLAVDVIRSELEKNRSIDSDFVINQLLDYIDEDTIPRDIDLSVEPVPLINEVHLTFNFQFVPHLKKSINPVSTEEFYVESVTISNRCELKIEMWYPFIGYTNTMNQTVSIDLLPKALDRMWPTELCGDQNQWLGDEVLDMNAFQSGKPPQEISLLNRQQETTVQSVNEFVDLFRTLQTDIEIPLISCMNEQHIPVDRVQHLTFPLADFSSNDLMPLIIPLASNLFTQVDIGPQSLACGLNFSSIDPRINFNGLDEKQWIFQAGIGSSVQVDSLGALNDEIIENYCESPDAKDSVVARNDGSISSPFELSYLLYSPQKPWMSIQLLKENDPDHTRYLFDPLHPLPLEERALRGLVSPYSPYESTIATIFLDLPINEYENKTPRRLSVEEAKQASIIFMETVKEHGWPHTPSQYADSFDLSKISQIVGSNLPRDIESYFRNTYELFNPRESFFTLILVAESGIDRNFDGVITDDESVSRREAIVYLWRDLCTQKSIPIFFGLTETLESSIRSDGKTWNDLLKAFNPSL